MSHITEAPPWYSHGNVDIWVGHAIDILEGLIAESVQAMIFSPPYWALRAYGTYLQIWGGDHNCEHDWVLSEGAPVITGGLTPKQVTNQGSFTGKAMPRPSAWNPKQWEDTGVNERKQQPAMECTKCQAWLGELGSEPYPDCLGWARLERCSRCYVCHMLTIFDALRRVLRKDGLIWMNIGDSYFGSGRGPTGHNGIGDQEKRQGFKGSQRNKGAGWLKPKDLCLIPQRLALALQADGWWIRSDVIWDKPNPMPGSQEDRPTMDHEYIWLIAKSRRYYYDYLGSLEPNATKPHSPGNLHRVGKQGGGRTDEGFQERMQATWGSEEGRNRRTIWHIPTEPSDMEMCKACETIFSGVGKRRIKTRTVKREVDGEMQDVKIRTCPNCKAEDKWLAHFATFPRALVEPCVKLATSEKGQCPECGKPWVRLTERGELVLSSKRTQTPHVSPGDQHRSPADRPDTQPIPNAHYPTKTIGWEPGCKCNAGEPIPQIVMDPFSGSGVTVEVARKLGRRGWGIELNPLYAKLAEYRLRQDVLPLF